MTDFTGHRSQRRDIQDGFERGVWGKRTDAAAGSYLSVRGTGTTDLEVPIVNMGYSFHLPENSNAEVLMVSLGSDVDDKVAFPLLGRDVQYQWPENTGGIQHPKDPARRVEFNDNELLLRDGTFVVGSNREVTITVDGTNVSINTGGAVNLVATGGVDITGDVNVTGNITSTGSVSNNGVNIGSTHHHTDTAGLAAGVTSVPF